ncbi:stemmadenine O-acetyltransferase-like [Euphorbia lathyris]|uniref:stemmadenine O-acetyltransferase-like n=1 Tax=Euphorbia lathyris TaxID=212925 RepID=UPI0033144152
MEVQIMFKETIKPSSSTPQHLKNYKLSFLDLIAPPLYIPIILFYSSTPQTSFKEKSDRLKKSLSKTLTLFYPMAGRIKNNSYIDCNDEGAFYTEAHATGDMSMLLQDPQLPQIEKLLPFDSQELSSDEEILGVQVNHFDCGGMAISICIWHKIADGSSAASFATTWAAVASGEATTNIEGIIYDCTSIFPPQKTQGFLWNILPKKDALRNSMMKRFVFDHSDLVALREKVGNGSKLECLGRPSRVETVTAVIWGAVIESTDVNTTLIAVNLRKRLIPPLPELSVGNIYHTANCLENENQIDYNYLAGKIHESIGIVKDDYVRKIYEEGSYFEFMKDIVEKPNFMKNVFGFSSWCRFPFYEVDFGWGKPIWVTTTLKVNQGAILIDTKDGKGIEAWVTLPKENMAKFQQIPYICSYASFNPTIY